MRRLASFALALALLSATPPVSADPPGPLGDVEEVFEDIDRAMYALCSVDGCFPPWYTDPGVFCAVFASLAPGLPGIADISWDGDLHVDGRRVSDCYPYDGGAEFDLSDTYAGVVQLVVDLLVAGCSVDLCVVPWWLCPVSASLSPGVPGVVDILAEGDLFVAGERYLDCPPYGS